MRSLCRRDIACLLPREVTAQGPTVQEAEQIVRPCSSVHQNTAKDSASDKALELFNVRQIRVKCLRSRHWDRRGLCICRTPVVACWKHSDTVWPRTKSLGPRDKKGWWFFLTVDASPSATGVQLFSRVPTRPQWGGTHTGLCLGCQQTSHRLRKAAKESIKVTLFLWPAHTHSTEFACVMMNDLFVIGAFPSYSSSKPESSVDHLSESEPGSV